MSTYPIKDISTTADRHKLYTLMCNSDELADNITFIQSHYINLIDICKDLANYIESLENYKHLNIGAGKNGYFDYSCQKLVEDFRTAKEESWAIIH